MNSEEIQSAFENLSNWNLVREGKAIQKKFQFKSFEDAFSFMTEISKSAITLNHHPEWSNTYSCVDIVLTTHDKKGLSVLDFKLAQCIDQIYDSNKS